MPWQQSCRKPYPEMRDGKDPVEMAASEVLESHPSEGRQETGPSLHYDFCPLQLGLQGCGMTGSQNMWCSI